MKAATDLLKLDAETHAKNWRPNSTHGCSCNSTSYWRCASNAATDRRIGAFSRVTREIYSDVEIPLKMSPLSESPSPDC